MKKIGSIGQSKKVLDVGCASGYLGKHLKNKGCIMVGIEIDKDCAQIAKDYYDEVIVADIETLDALPCPEHSFDVIVFADILEHLRKPDEQLAKFKRYLKKDGIVIASIPNIAHIKMRIKLLLGMFDYEDKGILDRTHLRFYTLKTVKRLFQNSGYNVINIDYTGITFKLLKFIPTLFAYQFILTAVPKEKEEPY